MTFEINPALVRAMANRYDDAVAPLAGYDFPTSLVSGDSFGHVELAAWYSAVADQFDAAGVALHDGTALMADNLRLAAHDAETADERAHERMTSPDLLSLLGGGDGTPMGSTASSPYWSGQ